MDALELLGGIGNTIETLSRFKRKMEKQMVILMAMVKVNFQKEIKTVEKSISNKVIRTMALDNENESFLIIGNELAFGKFHIDGKVFLLNKNENLTYITNTSEADLEIPQFNEEDYSLEKK